MVNNQNLGHKWKQGEHPSLNTEWKHGNKFSEEIEARRIRNLKGMLGKIHTEKTKEKIRISVKKRISDHPEIIQKIKQSRSKQIFPSKDTIIEVQIQNFLKELQIPFFTHQYMKIGHGYQCDIFIPSKKVVIECDGNYWHKYPIGREIDKIRTCELIQKGFKVLRLWESEIKEMNINKFRKLLIC